MPYNSALGDEVWLIILAMLDVSSLKSIGETSKRMWALSRPVLYSTIDLSIHHTASRASLQEKQVITQASMDPQQLSGRQSLFMQQISHRPELALLVRSFTWTMGLQRYGLPEWTRKDGTTAAIDKPENIYILFQSLRHALHVDIDGGDSHDYPCPSPQNLFPSATSIRLSGQMHYALAWSILCGPNKAPLKRLELSNLSERGRFQDGQNYQPRFDPRFRVTRQVLPLEEIWSEIGLPTQVAPGDMTRLVGPSLQSRCSGLRQVKLGILDLGAQYRHKMLPPGWCLRTPTIQEELKNFFQYVHPREVEIIYSRLSHERHEELESLFWTPHCRRLPRPPIHPQHTLWETLFEGWPGLEVLKVHGGQSGPDLRGPPEPLPSPDGRTSLHNVQVCFEPEDWGSYDGQICTSTNYTD